MLTEGVLFLGDEVEGGAGWGGFPVVETMIGFGGYVRGGVGVRRGVVRAR